MPNPYKLTERAKDELRNRSHEKLNKLFPDGPSDEMVRRITREKEAIGNSPSAYALLIISKTMRVLREHQFKVFLTGNWECSYYAWLLGLTQDDPIWLATHYQKIGFRLKELVRDGCLSSPLEIEISPGWGKMACLDLLRIHAREWGFGLWKQANDGWKLISEECRPDDIYAGDAPIIKIIARD